MLRCAAAVVFGLFAVVGVAEEKPAFDLRVHAKGGGVDVVYEIVGNGKWFRIAKRPERAKANGTLTDAELKKVADLVADTDWKSLPVETSGGEEGVVRYNIRITRGEQRQTVIRNADEFGKNPALKAILALLTQVDTKAKSR